MKEIVRWPILLLVMAGVFLSTMDSGMVNVALPTIMHSFGLSLGKAKLVVTLFLGTITVSLVFFGRLSDRLGKGFMYLAGVFVFSLGAVSCAFASRYELLLLSRIVQALGASMMMSTGPAIIKTVYAGDHLGRSIGLVGIATACGLLSGPLVSGLLLSHYSWHAIFVVSLPVSAFVFFAGWFVLVKQLPRESSPYIGTFDWRGSCCWVSMVVLFLFIVHRIDALLSVSTLVLFSLFAAALYIFVRVEKVASSPILPIQLLRQRYYWIAVITSTLSFAVLFTVLILIPFYLEDVLQLPIAQVGVVMMAVPATLIILSPLSGSLYDRIGARLLTTAGMGLSVVALLSLAFLTAESSAVEVSIKLALLGAGQSVFLSPNSASVLSQVGDRYSGITAGILATARNLGMVSGAALAAGLFAVFFSSFSGGVALEDYSIIDQHSFMLAMRATFVVTAIIGFCGSVLSVRRA